MDDRAREMIRNLPNNNVETILGCVDELATKTKAANIPQAEVTERVNAAYGRTVEHAGTER